MIKHFTIENNYIGYEVVNAKLPHYEVVNGVRLKKGTYTRTFKIALFMRAKTAIKIPDDLDLINMGFDGLKFI